MPLPPASDRQAVHARDIRCRAYRRSDGLWDIDGELLDTRTEPVHTHGRGRIEPGEPLHAMWMRLTVDETLKVRAIRAGIDQAPYPACPHFPADRLDRLVGAQIAPGWTARVRLALGGRNGCTHLVEMLGPLATTAIQAIYAWRSETGDRPGGHRPPPDFIDSCHSLAADGEAARHLWPERIADDD
ncbi:MAG TPA: DUF2889 domain-containing protein [Gammaproteobacteria bacterium]|nr:DUF2889 domain-containing protein [Gammaproteobacteria bacterium]